MDPEEKKKFNFGTGEIDTEKWLQGIDSGLEGYYKTYGNYWGKERTAEVQAAMQNLIGRISSGDMMSRGADGTYNFASQLYTPERNKYTKWAYRTALGYLSNVGRGLVTSTEAKKEEQKKNTPKYSQQTLIQRLNNSIMRGATDLKLENTWWNKATQQQRVDHLKNFFANEARYLRGSQDELGTTYSDLTKEQLASMMEGLSSTLSTTGDFTKQFNQLGIYNILNPTEVGQQQKTVDEQIAAYQQAEQDNIRKTQLGWYQNKQPDSYYNYRSDNYDNYKKYLDLYHQSNQAEVNIPDAGDNAAAAGAGIGALAMYPYRVSKDEYSKHFTDNNQNVTQFLEALKQNWESLFEENSQGLPFKDKDNNELIYSPEKLAANLAIFMYQMGENNKFTYTDQRQSPISVGNSLYYIPGTYRKTGDILLLDTYNKRLTRSNITKYPGLAETLGSVLYEKEGGILKFQQGGGYDPTEFVSLYRENEQPVVPKQEQPQQNFEWTAADYARIGGAAADIVSALSANVPGYGTAVSAVTGVGSTLANTAADWSQEGTLSGLRTLGLGLGTDLLGLIPGWGMSAKFGKIAKGLSRYAKYLGPALMVGGFTQAADIADKAFTQGFDSITPKEWSIFAQGLSGIAKGTSGVKRANRADLQRGAVTHYHVRTPEGTNIVTAEEFKKLREQGQVINSKPLVSREGLLNTQEQIIKNTHNRIMHQVPANRFEKMYDYDGVKPKNTWWYGEEPNDIILHELPFGPRNPEINFTNPFSKKAALDRLKKFREARTKKPTEESVVESEKNGGILKAQDGIKTKNGSPVSQNYEAWLKLQYNNPENYQTTLKGYKEAGSSDRDPNGLPAKGLYVNDAGEQDFMSAYLAQQNYYNSNGGKNIFGDALNYYNKYWLPNHQNGTIEDFINDYNAEVDWLRSQNTRKFGETAIANQDKSWGEYNERFNKIYGSYSPYSEELKNILGESTWQRMPNAFASLNDREDLRSGYLVEGDENSRVAIDNEGHLIQNDAKNVPPSSIVQSQETEGGGGTPPKPELKSPSDYRPLLMGARFATTGLANSWLYDRIEERLPGPAYKDFIDRKLDTIGDYAFRVHKANQGVDASSLQKLRQVSDQSLNLAADYETGRIRRGLEDEGYVKDAEKQAATHEAALQVDMKDLEDNRNTSWQNAIVRQEYLKQLADIRNARDKANADNIIALVNNLTGWGASLFTEKKAKYEQAKALMNPTPEERAQEIMKADPLYQRLLNGDPTLTTEEKNQIRINNLAALRQGRIDYATESSGGSTKTPRMKDDSTNTESKKAIRKEAKDLKFLRQNRVISEQLIKSKGISEATLKAEGFTRDTSGASPIWIKRQQMGGTLEYFKSLRK